MHKLPCKFLGEGIGHPQNAWKFGAKDVAKFFRAYPILVINQTMTLGPIWFVTDVNQTKFW